MKKQAEQEQRTSRTVGKQTLVESLYTRARRGEEVAVYLEERGHSTELITCGQLANDAEEVARGLCHLGVGRGDLVLIVLPTSRDFIVLFWGILRIGAAPVPIYPPANMQQLTSFSTTLNSFVRVAKPCVIITLDALRSAAHESAQGVTEARLQVATMSDLREAAKNDGQLPAPPAPDDVALVQFSSGSTDEPHGICLTHANLLANIHGFGDAVSLSPSDVTVSWLPLYHDMGLIGAVLGTFVRQVPLVLLPPTDFLREPAVWFQLMSKYRATVGVAPQFAFNLCLAKIRPEQLTGIDLSSVRFILNGAEPIQPEAIAEFEEKFAAFRLRSGVVTPAYGLGENALAVTMGSPGRGLRMLRVSKTALERHQVRLVSNGRGIRIVSCGRPVGGTEVAVRGPAGVSQPEGCIGEVCVRGDSTSLTFLTAGGPLSAVDRDGWVRTGDNGFHHDGELFITGRRKDLIIVGGRNLYPQDLEREIERVAGIRPGRSAAFGISVAGTGTDGIVVASEVKPASSEEYEACAHAIRQRLLRRFGVSLYDVVLLERGQFPVTSSGKIRRFQARRNYERASATPLFQMRRKDRSRGTTPQTTAVQQP
jgi:acyl-CoA synthetase (AMP-forming)/AMP-acid ligase II